MTNDMTNDITWSPVLSHDQSYGCPEGIEDVRCCILDFTDNSWLGTVAHARGGLWSWNAVKAYAIPMQDYVRITGIDIDEIPANAVWIAQDRDGEWWYSQAVPETKSFGEWATTWCDFNEGVCGKGPVLGSWKDTLIRLSDYPDIFGQRFAIHRNDEDIPENTLMQYTDVYDDFEGSQLPLQVAGYHTANNGMSVRIAVINGDMCIGNYPGGGSGLWHRWSGNVWKDCEGWSSDTDEWSLSGYGVAEKDTVHGPEEDEDGFDDAMNDLEKCRDMLREARDCFVEPHVLPSKFVKMQQDVIQLSEWLEVKYYKENC